ncbi:hypothetical protein GIB67_004411 [Kingdonia uniflora]|uniref:Uncharacterized protein n=1 Tax=Kingdonia uniflora TaxID=39325 RepID=A0A7J7MRI0_9MAGN|nr:hypothetical protein GIB67_014559 [Kingdonia uniflora]KAF6157473.1 hypothetical protein GIB67_004411 [Kingdonia uniflora]
MDPNPKKFPILSYVMSQFGSSKDPVWDEIDIEQPSPRSTPTEPNYQITDHMPHLKDPKVQASMASAISEVSQARSVLVALGDRPDHETVDTAKARIIEIDNCDSDELEEVSLEKEVLEGVKKERRSEVEKEMEICKAVVRLDEMHEAYEKLLKDAEDRLVAIYDTVAAVGGGGKGEEVSEEVNEEVVAILQEAATKGVEKVELSGRHLRILPEVFGKMSGLVVLDLSNNQLENIPDSIAGLENLEELNLSSNVLESLPDSIGLLLKLKFLNVSSNKLNALPDSISHCRLLVELDASYNRLAYLPTNIGYELVNLQKLLVHLNKIRSLPTSVCEMSSLIHLDAHFNELHGLPHAIGKLTNLEILNLSSNFSDMIELPETFGDLTNLRELDLGNNQIHALPNTFGRLDNLKKLNLDQNPLVIPPMEVVNSGVEAVKEFMANRWLEILLEEEQRSTIEATNQAQPGWLTRSTSWLNHFTSGYLGAGAVKSPRDAYLDQQL